MKDLNFETRLTYEKPVTKATHLPRSRFRNVRCWGVFSKTLSAAGTLNWGVSQTWSMTNSFPLPRTYAARSTLPRQTLWVTSPLLVVQAPQRPEAKRKLWRRWHQSSRWRPEWPTDVYFALLRNRLLGNAVTMLAGTQALVRHGGVAVPDATLSWSAVVSYPVPRVFSLCPATCAASAPMGVFATGEARPHHTDSGHAPMKRWLPSNPFPFCNRVRTRISRFLESRRVWRGLALKSCDVMSPRLDLLVLRRNMRRQWLTVDVRLRHSRVHNVVLLVAVCDELDESHLFHAATIINKANMPAGVVIRAELPHCGTAPPPCYRLPCAEKHVGTK